MTVTLKPVYSGSAVALTWTLASLASASYRQCTALDNSTNLYGDVLVTGQVTAASSGVSTTGYVQIFAYRYDGTNYTLGASGSDASFTPDDASNLVPVFTGPLKAANALCHFSFYLAAESGWVYLPQKWGLILLNGSGAALASTGNSAEYQGINYQGV